MKKIAILGCENSHAAAFLKQIAEKEEFKDLEVAGVYSDELPMAERMRDRFGVPILKNFDDAVGEIDGLVITARHGDNHYQYAKPYIESGIPMFIDKPITVSEEEAICFMRELRANHIRISGGSSLRHDDRVKKLKEEACGLVGGKTVSGYVRAPLQKFSKYGGFYFYAQHLVEMVGEVFGRNPISVTAKENGDQMHVLFHYEDYDCVGFFCNEKYLYYAARMAEEGSNSYEIPLTDELFYREFKEFYGVLSGEQQKTSFEDFIAPVFVMNAIARSVESGREEAVRIFKL